MQLAAFAKVNVTAPPAKQANKKDTRHRVEKSKKRKSDVAGMPGPVRRQGGHRSGGGFMGMSREEMEAMRQKVMKMSPEERQKYIEERRARSGGGGGGRGSRGGGRRNR